MHQLSCTNFNYHCFPKLKAIPPETIFCPGDTAPPFTSGTNPTAPTTSQPSAGSNSGFATGSPTPFEALTTTSPSAAKGVSTTQPSIGSAQAATVTPSVVAPDTATNVPSSSSAVSSKPTTGSTNTPPWALPDDTKLPTSEGGDASKIPSFSPTATPTVADETSAGIMFEPAWV